MVSLVTQAADLRDNAEALMQSVRAAADTLTEADARAVHTLNRETIGWLLGINDALEVE
jgi:hypothetical protein